MIKNSNMMVSPSFTLGDAIAECRNEFEDWLCREQGFNDKESCDITIRVLCEDLEKKIEVAHAAFADMFTAAFHKFFVKKMKDDCISLTRCLSICTIWANELQAMLDQAETEDETMEIRSVMVALNYLRGFMTDNAA